MGFWRSLNWNEVKLKAGNWINGTSFKSLVRLWWASRTPKRLECWSTSSTSTLTLGLAVSQVQETSKFYRTYHQSLQEKLRKVQIDLAFPRQKQPKNQRPHWPHHLHCFQVPSWLAAVPLMAARPMSATSLRRRIRMVPAPGALLSLEGGSN